MLSNIAKEFYQASELYDISLKSNSRLKIIEASHRLYNAADNYQKFLKKEIITYTKRLKCEECPREKVIIGDKIEQFINFNNNLEVLINFIINDTIEID